MGEMTAEDSDAAGALSGIGLDLGMAEASLGVGSLSITAVADIVIEQLELALDMAM